MSQESKILRPSTSTPALIWMHFIEVDTIYIIATSYHQFILLNISLILTPGDLNFNYQSGFYKAYLQWTNWSLHKATKWWVRSKQQTHQGPSNYVTQTVRKRSVCFAEYLLHLLEILITHFATADVRALSIIGGALCGTLVFHAGFQQLSITFW